MVLELIDIEPSDPKVVEAAHHLLEHALPHDLADDRFNERWVESLQSPESTFTGVIAVDNGHPVGLLAGALDRDRLQLDALVEAHVSLGQDEVFDLMLSHLRARPEVAEMSTVELWGKPAQPWHESVALAHGFDEIRALHQLRCRLPVATEGLPTRSFRPGEDDEALRLLNNASFAGHPDQGNLSPARFAHKLAEPGVTPAGIRLYEVEGELAGFCWTKIHPDRGLGEIYAIGLHPDHHGKGLGRSMTAAGLHWLHLQGLTTGMLYVEASNLPALRTYESLGFEIVRTDRAWMTSFRSGNGDRP